MYLCIYLYMYICVYITIYYIINFPSNFRFNFFCHQNNGSSFFFRMTFTGMTGPGWESLKLQKPVLRTTS